MAAKQLGLHLGPLVLGQREDQLKQQLRLRRKHAWAAPQQLHRTCVQATAMSSAAR